MFKKNLKLKETDEQVLKLAGKQAIEICSYVGLDAHALLAHVESLDISKEEVFESLEILEAIGYIKRMEIIDGEILSFSITSKGFERFIGKQISDYDSLVKLLFTYVDRDGVKNNKLLASLLNQSPMVVNHILTFAADAGYIEISEGMGATAGTEIDVESVSVELKRKLRS